LLTCACRSPIGCNYCTPEDDYVWLPRDQILSFEEISSVVDAFISVGVEKLRLTGGEPLLRRDLHGLVEILAAKPAVRDLAMTTNGLLFAKYAADLRAAGLGRVTIRLDTLQPDRFEILSRRGSHGAVVDALHVAAEVGFMGTKIDTVVISGFSITLLLIAHRCCRCRVAGPMHQLRDRGAGGGRPSQPRVT
jgi:cyclic pyranopterin phosphate synthase